jgi:hypothetical protein
MQPRQATQPCRIALPGGWQQRDTTGSTVWQELPHIQQATTSTFYVHCLHANTSASKAVNVAELLLCNLVLMTPNIQLTLCCGVLGLVGLFFFTAGPRKTRLAGGTPAQLPALRHCR